MKKNIRRYYTTIFANRKLSQKELNGRLKAVNHIEKGGTVIFCNRKKQLYCAVVWSGEKWIYMNYYKI